MSTITNPIIFEFVKKVIYQIVAKSDILINAKDMQSSLLMNHKISIPVWRLVKIMKEELWLSYK